MRTYFKSIFFQPFTESRKTMVEAIIRAAKQSSDQAVAGPRGDGKTRSALFVAWWLSLKSVTDFPLIVSKSGMRAQIELKNLKYAMTESELFAKDFPEIMIPILSLKGWASNAKQQTAYGRPTNLEWGSELFIVSDLPTTFLRAHGWNRNVASCARSQIFASLGIEGAIRGYSIRNRRPTLAIIDDIDDRESANSELQTANRLEIIDSDIAGLGGPDRNISRVMLCTLINKTCAAYVYTDRKQRPSFRGQRHRLISKMPERWDLCEEYIAQRQSRDIDADPDARAAHRWYLDHREQIEQGYETTNPYRYNSRPLDDGEPAEVSTLQGFLNWAADKDLKSALTELQNDPPEEAGPIESGITSHRVQRQVSGYPRKIVPPGCTVLTQGIDVRKIALHRVVRAWRPDGTGYTIDYGVQDVHGTTVGSDEGVDVAITRALQAVAEMMAEGQYMTVDGQVMPVDLTLVDAGWRTEAVYHATKQLGLGWMPAMGFGKSAGCVQVNFNAPTHTSYDRKPGDGWFMSKRTIAQNRHIWLVCMDTDRWKCWEHDRWMTPTTKPGTMFLFGESDGGERLSSDEKAHFSYSKHIVAEVEVEEAIKGVLKRRWKAKSDSNHYLDASYMCDVAANMKGIRLLKSAPDQQAAAVAAKGGWFAAQAKPRRQPA